MTFYFYPDGVSVLPSRLPPKVVSSSTGPIRNPFVNHSSVTLNRARSSSTEHLLLNWHRHVLRKKEQSVPSPFTVAEHMLQQNNTSEWMHTLLDASVERNRKAFCKRFTRCKSECPKKGSADRHGIPRVHSNQFICKKKHI